jgi:hypothetical protein
MPRREFRTFHVGDKVRILDDRREDWQTEGELTVTHVNNHGYLSSVGHIQTLTMNDGKAYSGWWFDPATVCVWAKKPQAVNINP